MHRRSFAIACRLVTAALLLGTIPLLLPSCGGDDGASPDAATPPGDGGGGSADGTAIDGSADGSGPDRRDTGAADGGTEVSGSVTPQAGGTLTLGTTTVTVPPGAVTAPTTITIRRIDPASVAALPSGLTGVGPMIALLPHGLTFSQPVTVTLGHTSSASTSTLVILSLDDEQDTSWETVAGASFTTTAATFTTTKFSVKIPSWSGATLLHDDPGPSSVGHIALGGGKLFYSRANPTNLDSIIDIRSISVDGAGPASVSSFPLPNSATNAMVTTATTLFFAAGQSVYSVPIAGGSATPAAIPCGAGVFDSPLNHGVPRLVTDGTQLFCTTIGSAGLGELKSFSFAGAPIASVSNLQAPLLVALDGTDILYSAFAGIQRISKTLTGAAALVIDRTEFGTGASAHGIALDATSIYVLTASVAGKAVVWRKPRAGGAIEPVTVPIDIEEAGARGLLLVDANLYFARTRPGNQGALGTELQRIAKTATSGVPLTLGGANPSNLAADGTHVYYGNGTELLRLPR